MKTAAQKRKDKKERQRQQKLLVNYHGFPGYSSISSVLSS